MSLFCVIINGLEQLYIAEVLEFRKKQLDKAE